MIEKKKGIIEKLVFNICMSIVNYVEGIERIRTNHTTVFKHSWGQRTSKKFKSKFSVWFDFEQIFCNDRVVPLL